MNREEARQAIKELEEEGLIEWNGQWRNGAKVYVITMKGRIRAMTMKETNE